MNKSGAKIKSRKTLDSNHVLVESFSNEFNASGLLIKRSDFDKDNQLRYYTVFNYDAAGNCILGEVFDAAGNLLHSNVFQYDNSGREISRIRKTGEDIEEWEETNYADEHSTIYTSRNEEGDIEHILRRDLKQNTIEGSDASGKIYSKDFLTFDAKGRQIKRQAANPLTVPNITEHRYTDAKNFESWKLYHDGQLLRSQEEHYDDDGHVLIRIRKDKNENIYQHEAFKYDMQGSLIEYKTGPRAGEVTSHISYEIDYLPE